MEKFKGRPDYGYYTYYTAKINSHKEEFLKYWYVNSTFLKGIIKKRIF